jgi:hypothetical protein
VEGRAVTGNPRVALLIDADNLSAAAMLDAAAQLHRAGYAIVILRAYGSADTLGNARDVLQRHGGRALVNQGRGTTDAALVVDAMDLLYAGELPAVVAIGSSDADFAPLAIRLRESGREVLCFAHANKADMQALERVYARVLPVADAVEPAKPATSRASRKATAKAPPARKKAAAPAVAPQPPSPPASAKARGTGRTASPDSGPVLQLLSGLPGFLEGKTLALNDVVMQLRKAGLMGKSAGATAFFRKQGLPVQLAPATQPNTLRWIGDQSQ